jgi:hypothetical protein
MFLMRAAPPLHPLHSQGHFRADSAVAGATSDRKCAGGADRLREGADVHTVSVEEATDA